MSPQNKLSEVSETYIDIGDGQSINLFSQDCFPLDYQSLGRATSNLSSWNGPEKKFSLPCVFQTCCTKVCGERTIAVECNESKPGKFNENL